MPLNPTVFIVDDDASVREGLDRLARSVGYGTCCFESVEDFMRWPRGDQPCCLLLDIRMPGRSGLDLQMELHRKRDPIPIIFLTGHGDVPMSVRAMKLGAVEFLLKPFREQDLLDALRLAIDLDIAGKEREAQRQDLLRCYNTLTERERHILFSVADGCLNRDIARQLGLQEITIKVHRAKAMQKLKANSIADVVTKVGKLRDIDHSKFSTHVPAARRAK